MIDVDLDRFDTNHQRQCNDHSNIIDRDQHDFVYEMFVLEEMKINDRMQVVHHKENYQIVIEDIDCLICL